MSDYDHETRVRWFESAALDVHDAEAFERWGTEPAPENRERVMALVEWRRWQRGERDA